MCQQHSPISATLVAVDPAVGKKRLSNKLAGYQIKAQLIPRISIAPFMQEWQMDFAHAVEASLLLSSDVDVIILSCGRETEAMS